jgi:hypothetical protein
VNQPGNVPMLDLRREKFVSVTCKLVFKTLRYDRSDHDDAALKTVNFVG